MQARLFRGLGVLALGLSGLGLLYLIVPRAINLLRPLVISAGCSSLGRRVYMCTVCEGFRTAPSVAADVTLKIKQKGRGRL